MEATHIDAFFAVLRQRDAKKWEWGHKEEYGYWIARYTGCKPPCTFYIEPKASWVYFHAPLKMTIWAECRLAVYRYALRLNEEMSGAKLGLSQAGELSLMVEWPTENLTFASFETAVQTLLTYYQTYFADIQLAGQNLDLAPYITRLEQQQLKNEEIKIEILKEGGENPEF